MTPNTSKPVSCLGLIPARGGSKSIPLKNMAPLHGNPLIAYVIEAGQNSGKLDLVCSTDHSRISQFCASKGVITFERPAELSEDNTPVLDVLFHVIETYKRTRGTTPDFLALLQPTSPFLLPSHITKCLELIQEDPSADAVQTIAAPPHNHHAFNQRVVEGTNVRFRFPEERKIGYNKQVKPKHYVFGNLVISRVTSLLNGKGIFGEKSLYLEIPPLYALDVDGPEDFEYAEYLLTKGKVILGPFL